MATQKTSATQDIQNGIKAGSEAARSAKTLAKAAANISTGNVAGAATEIIKNPSALKPIIAIALIPILFITGIVVIFLYALPNMIFKQLRIIILNMKKTFITVMTI